MMSLNNVRIESIAGPARFRSKMSGRNDYNLCHSYTVMCSQNIVSERRLRMTSQKDVSERRLTMALWWNGGARRQTAHHKHSAAPLAACQKEFVPKWGSGSRSVGRVRRYDTTWHWGSTQLPGSTRNPRKNEWEQKLGTNRVCNSLYNKMIWDLPTPGSPQYILPIAQPSSVTTASPLPLHLRTKRGIAWNQLTNP